VLQCVAAYCSVRCSVLQCTSACKKAGGAARYDSGVAGFLLQCVAVCCSVLQCTSARKKAGGGVPLDSSADFTTDFTTADDCCQTKGRLEVKEVMQEAEEEEEEGKEKEEEKRKEEEKTNKKARMT